MNWYQKIAHYFPVFHVSDDDQFGDIGELTEKKDLRYSLLTIWFGKYLIHILSIQNWKPSIIKILNLDSIINDAFKVNEESITRYTEALKDFDEKSIRDNIEALKIKISEQESRRTSILSKNSIYNAVLMVFITIAVPYLINLYKVRSIPDLVIVFFIIMFYISTFYFAYRIVRVLEQQSFTFNEIAKSKNTLHALASALYYRYKFAKSEADRIVTFGANQQKNIYQLFAMVIGLLILINVQGSIETKKVQDVQPISIYQFNDDNKMQMLQSLNTIEESLLTEKTACVNIVGGNEKQIEDARNIIEFYNIYHVPVNAIDSNGSTEMSLIVVKGDKK